jgi:NADP-dependent 3-hydroxy acid dehydrogenase YdfG
MSQNVAVITGVGGMGQAIARRIGPGDHLLLADFNEELLDAVAKQLHDEGYEATPSWSTSPHGSRSPRSPSEPLLSAR